MSAVRMKLPSDGETMQEAQMRWDVAHVCLSHGTVDNTAISSISTGWQFLPSVQAGSVFINTEAGSYLEALDHQMLDADDERGRNQPQSYNA